MWIASFHQGEKIAQIAMAIRHAGTKVFPPAGNALLALTSNGAHGKECWKLVSSQKFSSEFDAPWCALLLSQPINLTFRHGGNVLSIFHHI